MISKKILINIILIIFITLIFLFSGCTQNKEIEKKENPINCKNHTDKDKWVEECNDCSCENGKIICTKNQCTINGTENNLFENILDDIIFNQNLTNYEKEWLGYLEIKYPNSKLYHTNTKIINCENCYELYYKKDRQIIKIKVLNNEKKSETTITEIVSEIKNENICTLFQGEWNECPKVCETDEKACETMCGLPTCEFDYNKIIFKEKGEKCGGINFGDCAYGLTCFFEDTKTSYGICQ